MLFYGLSQGKLHMSCAQQCIIGKDVAELRTAEHIEIVRLKTWYEEVLHQVSFGDILSP